VHAFRTDRGRGQLCPLWGGDSIATPSPPSSMQAFLRADRAGGRALIAPASRMVLALHLVACPPPFAVSFWKIDVLATARMTGGCVGRSSGKRERKGGSNARKKSTLDKAGRNVVKQQKPCAQRAKREGCVACSVYAKAVTRAGVRAPYTPAQIKSKQCVCVPAQLDASERSAQYPNMARGRQVRVSAMTHGIRSSDGRGRVLPTRSLPSRASE